MDSLVELYREHLGLQNATFHLIDHEDAMVATVYRVTLPNGVEYILKIGTHDEAYLREVYFLHHFADKLPVPHIVQIIPPGEGVHGAILMECLPGKLLQMEDFTGKLAFEMGSLLARIHLNRVAGYGDPTQPASLNADPAFHFTLKFDEGMEECSNHLPSTLLDKCRLFYDRNLHLLKSVDGPCLIHRDFRAGNVIVDQGKIQGIIDWASGRASFAEDDFCPLEHGEWPIEPATKKAFLEGYANIRPVPDYSAIMPLLLQNRAIAIIGFTVKRGTWEKRNAKLYQFNRSYLENFCDSL